MSNTTRESGYYWVVYWGWQIAEYFKDSGTWFLTGTAHNFKDNDLEAINETRLPSPDEKETEQQ